MRKRILPDAAKDSFLEFAREQTRALRGQDRAPESLDAWRDQKVALRQRLARAYGEFPAKPCSLDPEVLGTIDRDGYRIERLIFQSRTGLWVTANAYVPTTRSGRVPAVLSVHGHWPWARVDPVPHARAVGLVRLGFFVLAVDAFGAGERAIVPAKGTYHGAILGASTWPVGTPLLGLQIYDNMRAVDYLISRPEVDGERLAITGASGGGNQSMNSGAWDERLRAVVPVCSVGTYDAYLGAACCVCEALPGGLTMAEEGTILGLVAPRALMVISATKDAFQFSVGEAVKSIARARKIYDVHSASDRIQHVVIESGHDYSKPMREAMYGWLAKWLRDEGDGSAIPEPEIQIEEVQTLRCFPESQRPKTFLLMPEFVHQQGQLKLSRLSRPDHREWWEADSMPMKELLEKQILGDLPNRIDSRGEVLSTAETADTVETSLVLYPEPKMPIPAVLVRPKNAAARLPTALFVDPAGKDQQLDGELVKGLLKNGWQVMAIDLRATGETAVTSDRIADVVDHNSSEWALWMGRPLLGQWCCDILCAHAFLADRSDVDLRRIAVIGVGAGGLAAICSAALEEQVSTVAAINTLSTFISPEPFLNQRMANFVPFILDVGDVSRLAALVAPRRLVLASAVNHLNQPLNDDAAAQAWSFTKQVYSFYGAPGRLSIVNETVLPEIGQLLRE